MLAHLADIPCLVSIFLMLQNILECCRLFGKYSSHIFQTKLLHSSHFIVKLADICFLPFVISFPVTFPNICCICTCFDFQNIFGILSATHLYLLHFIPLNISLVCTFCNLPLFEGLTFPWKSAWKERYPTRVSMNTGILPSPGISVYGNDCTSVAVLSNTVYLPLLFHYYLLLNNHHLIWQYLLLFVLFTLSCVLCALST